MDILQTGPRLRLRRAEASDIDYIMALEYDPANLPFIVPFPRELHLAAIQQPQSTMDVIVERVADGAPIGYLMLNGLDNTSREIEWTHVIIEAKGKGYGHEAMKLMKAWSFDVRHFHRGWLDCKDDNFRALHLYEAEGLQREGLIRETLLTDGRYENLVILGILDREFYGRRQQGQELPKQLEG